MKPIKELRQVNVVLLTLGIEESLDPQLTESFEHTIQDEWSSLDDDERFAVYGELLALATTLANVFTITQKIEDPLKVIQRLGLSIESHNDD